MILAGIYRVEGGLHTCLDGVKMLGGSCVVGAGSDREGGETDVRYGISWFAS